MGDFERSVFYHTPYLVVSFPKTTETSLGQCDGSL
jgi:hypothetical protein